MLSINNSFQNHSNIKFAGRKKQEPKKNDVEPDLCSIYDDKKSLMKSLYGYYIPTDYDRNPIISSSFRDEELFNPERDRITDGYRRYD